MTGVVTLFVRLVKILAGFIIGCLAASLFLNVLLIGSAGFYDQDTLPVATNSLVFSVPFLALFVAYFSFLPSIPAIAIAEFLGRRDWLTYALAGAVVATVVLGLSWNAAGEMDVVSDALTAPGNRAAGRAYGDPSLALFVIGAGICGGMAYWLVAGRSAGLWRLTSPGR